MTLSATVAAARSDLDNLAGWVKTFAEQHLPAIAAEAARIQASPIAQVLESAALTPAEEAMVARVIPALVDVLRGAQSAPGAQTAAPAGDGTQEPAQAV